MGSAGGACFVRNVHPIEDKAADWKEAEDYALLLHADRSVFAWEWLRRDPGYRAAADAATRLRRGEPSPEAWGLHRFEPPDRAAPDARPVWSAGTYAYVLRADAAAPAGERDAFDLQQLSGLSTIVSGRAGCEHLLIGDGLRTIRLDIEGRSLAHGAAHLRYRLEGLAAAERPLLTLRRFLAVCRTGRLSRSLHVPEVRARRWILMLRAWDAMTAGAGQREIAALLLSPSAKARRWRTESPSLRSQAQRLARGAARMAAGGWQALLRM